MSLRGVVLPEVPTNPQLYDALLAADPVDLLTPLVGADGGHVVSAAREDVVYRPGREALLRFAVHAERGGEIGLEGWVLRAGDDPPAVTHVLDGPHGPVAAWRVRDDPSLAGLRSALDAQAVLSLLADLGVPGQGLEITLLAYRPRRRAVVVARTPQHELYLKCVPPDKADALHRRHIACAAAGVPVPRAVGYDASLGLLVLTPVPGESTRSLLLRDEPALPPAEQLADLLASFAAVQLDEPARNPIRQAAGHAPLLRTLLPNESGRIDELLGRVQEAQDGPQRVVHGDYYDGQVLVLDGAVTGVVDVDGAGLGQPADDAANLLAHLRLLSELVPATSVLHTWQPGVAEAVGAPHDPTDLGRRTAAVLLGLATWPHSQHQPGWQEQSVRILDLVQEALPGPAWVPSGHAQ